QAVREAVDAINHALDNADHTALYGHRATRIPRSPHTPRLTTRQTQKATQRRQKSTKPTRRDHTATTR
ncbi:hypothetical protein ACFVTF_21790, partial [Kitasatospora sp. NPDC057940]|uniref:hypothetical protein n=1 Tax=Kitasatospora sp. NPDC057940 TaxID=3346285 RepID=UPI0036D7E9E4